MRIGFLGTGTITSAMVSGLCAAEAGYEIRVSPRNAEKAGELARRFPLVTVAEGNQELVDWSETVVIAVRPQVAEAVLRELRFREEQSAISVISGFNVERLRRLIAPVTRVTRAVPLPSAAKRRCPTGIYPKDAAAEEMFGKLGAAFAAETEEAFDAFCVATATMATYFAFADEASRWLVRHGIAEKQARDYMARICSGLSMTAMEEPGKGFGELAVEHATKGGTNEQVVKHMAAGGVFERYAEGLDGIMRRVRG